MLLWNKILTWCQNKDLEKVQRFLYYQNPDVRLKNEGDSEGDGETDICADDDSISTDNTILSREEIIQRIDFLENDYLNYCSIRNGETLLHAAVNSCCTELISLLLQAGGDPSVK